MSLAELKQRFVNDLRGEWSRAITEPGGSRAQNTFLTNRASRALNVRFDNGRVIGRDGFLAGLETTGKVTAIYQWLAFDSFSVNKVLTFENGELRIRDLIFPAVDTLEAIAGAYGAAFAEGGNRVYAATYTSNLAGASEVRIAYSQISGAATDKAFMGPMSTVPTSSEPSSGLCGAGTRRLAYVVTSRSGFRGKPSPYAGAVFSPITHVGAADKTIRLSIAATWPADAAYVSAVMTTIENLEAYYLVPSSEIAVTPGSPYTADIDISITDADLVLGTILTETFSYLTQSGGVGPITPPNIRQWGNRLAYHSGYVTYVSDPDDYEAITADQHVIYLPGQREVVTSFKLRGVIYLLGPKWTYATVDNSDVPVTWESPYDVSLALGTTCIHGVEVSTQGDRAWVANEAGLWDFEGAYKDVPVSYMNENWWKRINWFGARHQLRIVDDVVAQIVYVFVPLDDATDLSHVLTWNYSRGRGPTQVDFALYELGVGQFSSAALVRDWTTQKSNVWVGPDDASVFLVQDRDTIGNDNDIAFETPYETGEIFKRRQTANAVDMKMQALEATVKGAGALRVSVNNKGRTETITLDPVSLEELPTDSYQESFYLESPDGTIEFKVTGTGERMDIESFTLFYHPTRTNR